MSMPAKSAPAACDEAWSPSTARAVNASCKKLRTLMATVEAIMQAALPAGVKAPGYEDEPSCISVDYGKQDTPTVLHIGSGQITSPLGSFNLSSECRTGEFTTTLERARREAAQHMNMMRLTRRRVDKYTSPKDQVWYELTYLTGAIKVPEAAAVCVGPEPKTNWLWKGSDEARMKKLRAAWTSSKSKR